MDRRQRRLPDPLVAVPGQPSHDQALPAKRQVHEGTVLFEVERTLVLDLHVELERSNFLLSSQERLTGA